MNNNINNDFINSAVNASGGKLDAEAIKKAAKSGNASEIINHLSDEDKNKINNILNDKASLSALLKSPQALEILKNSHMEEKMDELSEKLAGLLNDPDTMERVRQMAENLLGNDSAPEQNQPSMDIANMLPGEDLGKIISIISQLKNTGNDSRTMLLNALKPHLSEPKREKVDTAIKILRLLELLPLIKDTGLLNI